MLPNGLNGMSGLDDTGGLDEGTCVDCGMETVNGDNVARIEPVALVVDVGCG